MRPLRLAFLWHYHQPEYRFEGVALLPWARLRAVKDYATIFALLERYPRLELTLNVVPSLLAQLRALVEDGVPDRAELLCLKPAEELTEAELEYLRALVPPEPLLERCPAYRELLSQPGEWDAARRRALQMWVNLAWMLPHRARFPIVGEWLERREFHADDIRLLLLLQRMVAREALERLRRLARQPTLELSCSPLYHPILPLLCDTESAAESDPELPRPQPAFRFPADAWLQCTRARERCWEELGVLPSGMWPSEGALSMAALESLAAAGVRWVATDEALLAGAQPPVEGLQRYLPHRIRTRAGELVLLFRDRELSDAIGFVYGTWEAERAVEDFCQRLEQIRQELLRTLGEQALERALVLVALDGENCWDGYPDNGRAFLTALYDRLMSEERFRMVCCREALSTPEMPVLERIGVGSWMQGSLRIWIGSPESNAAWQALAQARARLESARGSIPMRQWVRALEHLLVAEGSDWFWWIGGYFCSPAQPYFRELFRRHVERAEELCTLA
jgi:alpha-amylase/alpha-mannosidase (GH57 family)